MAAAAFLGGLTGVGKAALGGLKGMLMDPRTWNGGANQQGQGGGGGFSYNPAPVNTQVPDLMAPPLSPTNLPPESFPSPYGQAVARDARARGGRGQAMLGIMQDMLGSR